MPRCTLPPEKDTLNHAGKQLVFPLAGPEANARDFGWGMWKMARSFPQGR